MKWKKILVALLIITILIGFISVCLRYRKENNITIQHRLEWWLEDINWDKGRSKWTGDGVAVAVIDSGVDASHPDLENTSIQEYRVSSLKNSEEGPLSHGTEVAGVIAAYPKTEEGVLGVAPGVSILSVDVTDSEIIGDDELIEGIEYATEQGVDVINISIGTPTDSEELHEAVKKAYQAGIVIVAAAGNYMRDDVLYPAKYDEVIAVGSRGKKGGIISPSSVKNKNVCYLPGENIVTTYSGDKDRMYAGGEGTSFSTPILSGIICLYLQKHPEADVKEIYGLFSDMSTGKIDVKAILKS